VTIQQQIKSDRLLTPEWIAANLNNPDVRVIEIGDLKDPDAYYTGHIPGALLWPWQECLWHPTMREFVQPPDFAKLMQRSGVGPDTTIVFYSNLAQYSTYAFWVCTMRGHKNIKIMNGHRNLWIEKGLPITLDVPSIEPADYPVRDLEEDDCRIGREGVLAGLDNSDRVLIDMRTPEEYYGERVSPSWFEVDHGAARKGHIPGAKHLYYVKLLYDDESFKPVKELQEYFSEAGATPDKEIVTYCRLSHRGTMAWFIMKYLLGYPRVKVYDGSWTEWGSMVGVPIVNETLSKKSSQQ
jgi:thiosulfate/3-mercaptopyruvate sulfurtransferase